MNDTVFQETAPIAAPGSGRKTSARKRHTPSGNAKREVVSTAIAGQPLSDPAATTLANTGAMTAGPLLGDYPSPASPHRSEPHCDGTYTPRWLNWPKRCERALLRYLATQQGHGFALDLARGEVEAMDGRGTSSVTSSVQRSASAAA